MDEKTFNDLSKRIRAANKLIAELDPVLRDDAWAMVRPYVAGETSTDTGSSDLHSSNDQTQPKTNAEDEDVLIEEHESDKESDNLYLVLAILFKRHGRGPFSMDLIKSTGKHLDLPLPNRPDTTFRNSTKKVARKQEGGYKIQPGGETWLKDTYGVKKGKSPIPSAS